MKGNYSYITAKITEEMYREEQMELMKDFWHDGSGEGIGSDVNTHNIKRRERRIKGFDQ